MIECYTKNASEGENEAVTWNNTSLKKGCTVEVSGASIQFNKCGIYELSCNATVSAPSATSSAPVDVEISLAKNGSQQPQAQASATISSETEKAALSFVTLVQVSENNSCCPCSSPTICSVVNTGAAATFDNINLVVTKLV